MTLRNTAADGVARLAARGEGDMPIWTLAGLLVLIAALALMSFRLLGVWSGAARRRRRGTIATGVVVHVESRGEMVGEGTASVDIPTVEFVDTAGRSRRFRNPQPVHHCPAPGGQLPVWYDPDQPDVGPEVVPGSIAGATAGYLAAIVLIVLLGAGLWWFGAEWTRGLR